MMLSRVGEKDVEFVRKMLMKFMWKHVRKMLMKCCVGEKDVEFVRKMLMKFIWKHVRKMLMGCMETQGHQ